MKRIRSFALLGAVAALGLTPCGVMAQGVPGGASYRPSQPTFSNWLNLYQKNSGPLGNYHTFVRPGQQLQETLRQQDTMLQEQGEGIRELTGQVNAVQQRRNPAHPTGAGSVFMEYAHYYDLKGPANRPRGSASRTPGRSSYGAH